MRESRPASAVALIVPPRTRSKVRHAGKLLLSPSILCTVPHSFAFRAYHRTSHVELPGHNAQTARLWALSLPYFPESGPSLVAYPANLNHPVLSERWHCSRHCRMPSKIPTQAPVLASACRTSRCVPLTQHARSGLPEITATLNSITLFFF